jgi:hypothetical protein
VASRQQQAVMGGGQGGGGQGGGLAVPPSKAAKNTGLPQKKKNLRKNGRCFVLFFSPFSPGRCAGPVRAFWVNFTSSTEIFANIFEISTTFFFVRKVLGP